MEKLYNIGRKKVKMDITDIYQSIFKLRSKRRGNIFTSWCRCLGGRRPPPQFSPTEPLSPWCQWSRAVPAAAAALDTLDPSSTNRDQWWRTQGKNAPESFWFYLSFPQSRHQAQCHWSEPGGADQRSQVLQHQGGAELQQKDLMLEWADWLRADCLWCPADWVPLPAATVFTYWLPRELLNEIIISFA